MITSDGGKLMMGQLILPTCDDHMQVHVVRQSVMHHYGRYACMYARIERMSQRSFRHSSIAMTTLQPTLNSTFIFQP